MGKPLSKLRSKALLTKSLPKPKFSDLTGKKCRKILKLISNLIKNLKFYMYRTVDYPHLVKRKEVYMVLNPGKMKKKKTLFNFPGKKDARFFCLPPF